MKKKHIAKVNMDEKEFLRPGSDEAVTAGCRCPILDNQHGYGYWSKDIFVMDADCPLHGSKKDDNQ